MGTKKLRKEKFLKDNRYCCLCGGKVLATTIEHSPPRVLFLNKEVPGAFRFPACERCNSESSQSDQVAALATLIMGGALASHIPEDEIVKLWQAVANNSPEAIRAISGTTSDVEIRVRGLIRPLTRVEISPAIYRDWLNPWAAKLTAAFWYKEVGTPLEQNSAICVQWLSNANIHENGVPEQLFKALPKVSWPKQGKLEYSTQFFYRFGAGPDNEFGCFVFSFHDTSAAIGFAFKDKAKIDRFRSYPVFGISHEEGIYWESEPVLGRANP